MNNSIYRVCLDVHTTHSQTQLDISKGDTAREIEFTLTDGGALYSVSDSCTAIFRAEKPDGTVLYNSCEVGGDKIAYQLTSQTSASVGILQCELQLIGENSEVLTAPRFTMRVADTVYSDDEVESVNEFTELTTAITQANNLDIDAAKSGSTTTVTITDKNGTQTSVQILDGEKGDKGDKGDTGGSVVTATSDSSDKLATITIDGVTYRVTPVSGSKTGSNWSSITINGIQGDLKGNISSAETVSLGSGWSGSDATLERGGFCRVLKVTASYVTGGKICTIPSAHRSVFGGYAIGIILRGNDIVGTADVSIASSGEVSVVRTSGVSLAEGDTLELQATWVS